VEPSEPGIAAALSRIVRAAGSLGLHPSHRFSIELCLQEALVNALVHGVRACGGANIVLRCEIDSRGIRIAVEDDGFGFPAKIGPSIHRDSAVPDGWGLFLIRAFMSRVSVDHSGHAIRMELDFYAGLDSSTEPSQPKDSHGAVGHASEYQSSTTGDFHAD
jgi:anti-sigma regulatory factor (Ser/Thr protein kinase)